MKYLIILTLILFVCDISAAEEGKSENLIAVTIDFREKQPPNIVELKSELILGFNPEVQWIGNEWIRA